MINSIYEDRLIRKCWTCRVPVVAGWLVWYRNRNPEEKYLCHGSGRLLSPRPIRHWRGSIPSTPPARFKPGSSEDNPAKMHWLFFFLFFYLILSLIFHERNNITSLNHVLAQIFSINNSKFVECLCVSTEVNFIVYFQISTDKKCCFLITLFCSWWKLFLYFSKMEKLSYSRNYS